jgi:hypothetical protein
MGLLYGLFIAIISRQRKRILTKFGIGWYQTKRSQLLVVANITPIVKLFVLMWCLIVLTYMDMDNSRSQKNKMQRPNQSLKNDTYPTLMHTN